MLANKQKDTEKYIPPTFGNEYFGAGHRHEPRDVAELIHQFKSHMSFGAACRMVSEYQLYAVQNPTYSATRDIEEIQGDMYYFNEVKRLIYYLDQLTTPPAS